MTRVIDGLQNILTDKIKCLDCQHVPYYAGLLHMLGFPQKAMPISVIGPAGYFSCKQPFYNIY